MSKTKIAIMDDSLTENSDKIGSNQKTRKSVDQKKNSDTETEKSADTLILADTPVSETLISSDLSENKPKKAKKPGKQKKYRSKKYKDTVATLDRSKAFNLNDSIEEVKKLSYSKFPGTLEIHINTNQSGIRGLVSLPFSSGKKITILAFGKDAEKSGADIVGDESKIEEISKGKINFDLVVTTAEWMPKLAKIAKNLGPRGLMPSPKNGTITDDLKKAIEGFQAGKTEYKSESKAKLMHLGIGKLSQPTEELASNLKVLLSTIGKTKIKKIALSPTMGPSVKVELSSI